MKKYSLFLVQLLVVYLLASSCLYAQFVVDGVVQKNAKIGESVTFSWVCPDSPDLQYFRIRRAQTSSGSYNAWVKLPKDLREYTFVVSDNKTYNYFITAWYSTVDSNGNTIVVESVGSNHVRINIVP